MLSRSSEISQFNLYWRDGELCSRTLVMAPKCRWIEQDRLVRCSVGRHVIIPDITMDQNWLDGSSTGLQRPKEPGTDYRLSRKVVVVTPEDPGEARALALLALQMLSLHG
jgi:hypothetical protein